MLPTRFFGQNADPNKIRFENVILNLLLIGYRGTGIGDPQIKLK
jgi:hypothetical protein